MQCFQSNDILTIVLILRIRHCQFLGNAFPNMNYDATWFVGPLGWITDLCALEHLGIKTVFSSIILTISSLNN